ncbi:hypothetical protein U1Q18_024707 [Sarracenia purpurea var. burkii]
MQELQTSLLGFWLMWQSFSGHERFERERERRMVLILPRFVDNGGNAVGWFAQGWTTVMIGFCWLWFQSVPNDKVDAAMIVTMVEEEGGNGDDGGGLLEKEVEFCRQ